MCGDVLDEGNFGSADEETFHSGQDQQRQPTKDRERDGGAPRCYFQIGIKEAQAMHHAGAGSALGEESF